MFERTFKNINNILHKDAGCGSELDYLDDLEKGKIQNMGNAGRNGGEYYTPRPLIRTIVKVVSPSISDKVYDGAVGSAGFLGEAFEFMKESNRLTTKDVETLQKGMFYGKEKKSLAYIIGIMNMILHSIEAPNIVHTNTLAENLADIQEKDYLTGIVFLITTPALPSALRILMKCWRNRNAVSPVLIGKFCFTSARSLPPKGQSSIYQLLLS